MAHQPIEFTKDRVRYRIDGEHRRWNPEEGTIAFITVSQTEAVREMDEGLRREVDVFPSADEQEIYSCEGAFPNDKEATEWQARVFANLYRALRLHGERRTVETPYGPVWLMWEWTAGDLWVTMVPLRPVEVGGRVLTGKRERESVVRRAAADWRGSGDPREALYGAILEAAR